VPQGDVCEEKGVRGAAGQQQLNTERNWQGVPRGTTAARTQDWLPSCECGTKPVPCTVLDPFSGAGTTGLVADRIGRDAVLIELKPEYAAMTDRRIRRDAGMFADINQETTS
jgi:hypothetical protein